MKKNQNSSSSKGKNSYSNGTNGFLPNSLKFISSCIKTVSSNVRSAGASVAGSIAGDHDEQRKDQVLWASFDRLELGQSSKRVLLLGYSNGFQVLDVQDASNVRELVSRRDDPVTFLQMQPVPEKSDGCEGFRKSHPMLLVVAGDDIRRSGPVQNGIDGLSRDGCTEPQTTNLLNSPTAVRFYSFRSHNYVHVLRFRSAVYMVRCSPRVVAVGLAAQIYCFDALKYENKFSVLTYPVPQLGSQGNVGVNVGYGPMAVGSRWLAYASNNPLMSNTGRLSPQSLSPSPGVSPSTSPSSSNLVARYAMESSKQLATGLINLSDMSYKTLSRYCHELLPDGSSLPASSNSSWRAGRVAAHSVETDNAGMVVIKDFVSRAVVSQFRAHTSPISALCFDPSGTLLVTASIHGNNINIFRIMPSSSQTGSGTHCYDWSSSHVHLYKLHRGMTSAVIQDICFSYYSQWIAIVSSRGTCHIFVLSPFGGETGLQLQNSDVDGLTLSPILSVPWWSASVFIINQQSSPPPAPVTLSVTSRIKNGGSGWLNAVSNAASTAAGKVSVPTGVVAAVFHSLHDDLQPALSKANTLEHLLVYSPSGNLIQYELLPSIGVEHEPSMKTGAGTLVQMQEEELRVRVEPVQWWDVCRRANWPEREEFINGIIFSQLEDVGTDIDTFSYDANENGEKDSSRPCEQSHLYLSNAELQMRSASIPIWQKSKIYFYSMSPLVEDEKILSKDYAGGEIEIEKFPVNEIEIRRKDLLPVFDHFHRIHSDWSNDRDLSAESNCDSRCDKDKITGDTLVSHAKFVLPECGVVENLRSSGNSPVMQHSGQMDAGRPYSLVDPPLTENNTSLKRTNPTLASSSSNQRFHGTVGTTVSRPVSSTIVTSLEEGYVVNSLSSPIYGSLSAGGAVSREAQSSNSVVTGEFSNTSSNRSDLSMNFVDEGLVHEDMHESLDFVPYFQEEYYKATANDEHKSTNVTDAGSGNSLGDKKSEEDGESDDMLGGVFDFSEEDDARHS